MSALSCISIPPSCAEPASLSVCSFPIDREVMSTFVEKKSMDNPSCKEKTASFNHKMFNTRQTIDSSGPKPTPSAVCRCKRRCFKKFSESRTREVYETFWEMDVATKRKKWVLEHVPKAEVKQWKRKRKPEMRNYFLTDERGCRLKVCAGYFQRVLGFPNGSLLEPMMGHINHDSLADPLQNISPVVAQRRCIQKDRTERSINMCCVISKDKNKDKTGRCVHLGDSRKRNQRKSTSKDRTVSKIQKSSLSNKNETDHNIVFDAGISNSGKAKSSHRKSTSKDRIISNRQISSSSNRHETDHSLMFEADSGKKKATSTCGTSNYEGISDSGNKKRIKVWDKVNSDSRKRDLRRAAVYDRTFREEDNVSVVSKNSLIRDKDRDDSRKRDLRRAAVYDRTFREEDNINVGGKNSLIRDKVRDDSRKNSSSLVSGDGHESQILKKRRRSYSIGGDRFESEIPVKRRRSTRTTKMKGSMGEENLLKIDVEATETLDSGSAHEDLIPDEQNDLGFSKMKLKLHANPQIQAKQSLDKSEILQRPRLMIKIQDNKNNHCYEQEINEPSPQFTLPALRSRRHPRDSTTESHNASEHTIRKQARSKNIVKLRNNKRTVGSKQSSNKLVKLSTLNKKNKHPMLPACHCSRRRCIENIREEWRMVIHHQFWNLNSCEDRRRWLVKFVEKRERKNKVLSLFPQRKNESKRYFLPNEKKEVVEVCRLFFIHTLGFRWDNVVDAAVRDEVSSGDVGCSRHQMMKLPQRLPDHVVDSVSEYLLSVRNSAAVTGKAFVDGDVRKMFDVGRTNEGSHEITSCDDQSQDLPRLKIKDLFQNWKINNKNLKFNLGYQSFRRIFQTVIDPVPVGQVEDRQINQNINTKDVGYSLPIEISCNQPGSTDHHNTATESFSEEESEELKSDTSLKGSSHTESVLDPDLTVFTKSEMGNLMVDRKSICQDDKCTDLKNGSELQENLVKDNGNYILDVGSGLFRQAEADTIKTDNSHSDGTGYRKRQSLSLRNDRNNYPLLPPCKCRKRKCAEKFTESQRQEINTMFWDLGCYNQRKQWILEHIKRAGIKRRIVFSEGTARKQESRWYYLPLADGSKVDVCKAFFLRTLGYRWDSVIDTIGKTTPKGVEHAALDKRGRKPPPHKISQEAVTSMVLYIENICNTFQHVDHKRNQDHNKGLNPNPQGKILLGLTMKQLFEDYKCKHPNHKFGYESFRKVFRRVRGVGGALMPPNVDANDKTEKLQPVLEDENDLVKENPVGKDCLVENMNPIDKDYSLTKDDPVGKDCFDKADYLVDKNCFVRKDFSAEDYYLVNTDCSLKNNYIVTKDCLVPENYLVDKEAAKEGSYSSFRSENSHFGPKAVSFSQTNLQMCPQHPSAPLPPPRHQAAPLPPPRHQAAPLPPPQHPVAPLPPAQHPAALPPPPQHPAVPSPPPQATPSTHPATTHQQQQVSHALKLTGCLYEADNRLLDSQRQLPIMQVPIRVESLASDPFHSTVTDPSVMYHHNLHRPPTGGSSHLAPVVSGHLTRCTPGQLTPGVMSEHLRHSNCVNTHTNIDSATCRAQNQCPSYFVPNPESFRYHVASQYQSMLHHVRGCGQFFSYPHRPDNTFNEPYENQTFAMKQNVQRRNMDLYNIQKTAYGYISEPASVQGQNPSHVHPMHFNVEQESAATISSPYSDENDSFVQDQVSNPANIQGSSVSNFNNSSCTKESKESASKDNTCTKKGKSEKKKVEKEIKMKQKSLRNYREHYPMLATCNCKKKKCNEKFSTEARQKLHDNFWDLTDYNERKQWMLQHIKREDCKRRRIDQFESFRKLESRWYFFPDESGNQHEVCKDFFLRTLGYKWDSVIDTIRRTTPKGETTTRPDQRGRKAPAHKLSSAVLRSVVQYIKSMQQVSQPLNEYDKNVEDSNCEKDHENGTGKSGGEIAVPYGLTMKDLYEDYKAKHVGHKIGYESFRRIFRDPSKSEKIVFNDRTSEDEFLNLNNDDGFDF